MIIKNEYFPQTVSHPGVTLKEKLQEMEMSQKGFAIRIAMNENIIADIIADIIAGKGSTTTEMAVLFESIIADIIAGKGSITTEMAVLFESILRIPAHFWINRQKNYDEYIAENKKDDILKEDKQIYKFV